MRFAWPETIWKAAVMADARTQHENGFYASLNQSSTSDILPSWPKRKKTSKGSFYKVDRLIASRIISFFQPRILFYFIGASASLMAS